MTVTCSLIKKKTNKTKLTSVKNVLQSHLYRIQNHQQMDICIFVFAFACKWKSIKHVTEVKYQGHSISCILLCVITAPVFEASLHNLWTSFIFHCCHGFCSHEHRSHRVTDETDESCLIMPSTHENLGGLPGYWVCEQNPIRIHIQKNNASKFLFSTPHTIDRVERNMNISHFSQQKNATDIAINNWCNNV